MPGYTNQAMRQKSIDQNPGWSEEVKKNVLSGEIAKGMTQAQVRAAWGNPTKVDSISDPNGTVIRWNYFDNNYLFFYGDELAYWQQQKG